MSKYLFFILNSALHRYQLYKLYVRECIHIGILLLQEIQHFLYCMCTVVTNIIVMMYYDVIICYDVMH